MRVLVTGGTGFIGRHLVDELLRRGLQVRCLVRNPDPLLEKLGVEQVAGDVTNRDSLLGIADDVDAVYHLAAAGHVGAVSAEALSRFKQLNVGGLMNMLAECAKAPTVSKFIHFSSTAAMGLIEGMADENSRCKPSTPYQLSKRESEEISLKFYMDTGFPVVIIRPSMVYGPGDRSREFLSMCKLVKLGVFPIPDGTAALTPLVYVTDVAQAAILAAERGRPGEIYIITGERSYPVIDLAQHIGQELGVSSAGVRIPKWPLSALALLLEKISRISGKSPTLSRQRVASIFADRSFDITKAHTELGYEPKVGITEGIANTITWFREQGFSI